MRVTQYEVESEIGEVVGDICRRDIAAQTGTYPTVMYAYFNPNDERKSPQFETLRIQAALDAKDAETGERHWRKLCELRERSLTAHTQITPSAAAVALDRETSDVTRTALEHAPLTERLREAVEARTAAENNVKAILAEIAASEGETVVPMRSKRASVLPANIAEKARARR